MRQQRHIVMTGKHNTRRNDDIRIGGTIRSFVAAKRFGFINGDDGQTYFFHMNGMSAPVAADHVAVGALVAFEPHPGPKGMEARRVTIDQAKGELWTLPKKVTVTRDDRPRRGEIFAIAGPFTCSSSDAPDTARHLLIRMAESLGANAILGLRYTKGTGSSGNYRFTIHMYSGSAAVIAESQPCTDLERIRIFEGRRDSAIEEFWRLHQEYLRKLADEVEKARLFRRRAWIACVVIM
jgi:cold shock CspA family protein